MTLRPDRRHFLQGLATASALLMSRRGLALSDVESDEAPPITPPVVLGVVGLGSWGREILSTLTRLPYVEVAGLCDTYGNAFKKALTIAPKAARFDSVDGLLAAPGIEAVVVATPSHRHREVVEASLAAGKHVYCEAPLAHTLDEARAIARAAKASPGRVFQGGLQGRANALYRHVSQFVKSGVLGREAVVSARFSTKDSWRRVAPTPAREQELNWRLSAVTSPGLVGEVGVHQIDLMGEYLGLVPEAAIGLGATRLWDDGRDVPDTVQCILEYPKGLRAVLQATLVSSSGGNYVLFQGSNASLLMMEKRGWMIKEADSALLGWEVYARKEPLLSDTGIAMVADSTKLIEAGKEPGEEGALEPEKAPLELAFEAFCSSIRLKTDAVCGPAEAFKSTAIALLAESAVRQGARVAIDPAALELA